MAKTSTKVFVIEVMGRHTGWIAAAGGLAADKNNDIPIVILFPEIEFNQEKFIAKVDVNVKKYEYCSIVVSEGARWPDGKFLAEQGTHDAFGHAQLGGAAPVVANMIKEALGYKYHWAVADYLQRSARHIASKTDVEQAYALGKAAVDMVIAGENAVMPTVVRKSDSPYIWEIGKAKLEDVANVEKKMPKEWLVRQYTLINARDYLQPLIAGEDYPPYKNGMPQYVTLKNKSVTKIVNTEFSL